jgi:hypothetical protein
MEKPRLEEHDLHMEGVSYQSNYVNEIDWVYLWGMVQYIPVSSLPG